MTDTEFENTLLVAEARGWRVDRSFNNTDAALLCWDTKFMFLSPDNTLQLALQHIGLDNKEAA